MAAQPLYRVNVYTFIFGKLKLRNVRIPKIKRRGNSTLSEQRYCHTVEQIRGRDPRLGHEPLTYHLVPLKIGSFLFETLSNSFYFFVEVSQNYTIL